MRFSPHSVAGVTLFQVAALVLPVAVAGAIAPLDSVYVLATAMLTALVWEMIFAGVRKRAFTAHGVTTALIVILFCPPEIALWQLAFVMSLGVIFGELIFGGRGFGFVSPAALTLSLMFVAFPDIALRATSPEMALAVVPGLVLLVAVGLVSPSVLVGLVVGCLGLLVVTGQGIDAMAIGAALSVGAVFLIADPNASSSTAAGRWVYGLLAGGLIVVFSPAGAISPEAIVAAALLASVFAPLVDHCAILIHTRRRRWHG